MKASSLQTLELQDNGITAATAMGLSQSLCASTCPLTDLDLSWNLLRAAGAWAIADGLKDNTTLRCLRLSWNAAGQKGGVGMAEAMRVNTGLRTLDLQHNGIDGVAAIMIADALRDSNKHLTSLDLSHNPLGRKACESVMRALTTNSSLVEIGLQAVEGGISAEASDPSLALITAFDPKHPGGEYTLNLAKPWERFLAVKLQQLAVSRREPWESSELVYKGPLHFSRNNRLVWSEKKDLPEEGTLKLKCKCSPPHQQPPSRQVQVPPGEKQQPPSGRAIAPRDVKRRTARVLVMATWALEACRTHAMLTRRRPLAQMPTCRLPPDPDLADVDFKPKQQTTIHYSLDLAEPSEREIAISLWQRATIEPGENWINETMDGKPFQMDEDNLGWDLPTEG